MALEGSALSPHNVLQEQLKAKNIPFDTIQVNYSTVPPVWVITYKPEATPEEIALGNQIAADFDGRERIFRPLYEIHNEVTALTQAQKDLIDNDLTSGNPIKMLTSGDFNASSIYCLHFQLYGANMPSSVKRIVSDYITSLYCQDVPYYLDKPKFDPTIVILGVR